MDCFDILGISSNSDKKAIKHAYAKLLKKYNPEDDPEGYQKLREAYDNALKYEKSRLRSKPAEPAFLSAHCTINSAANQWAVPWQITDFMIR